MKKYITLLTRLLICCSLVLSCNQNLPASLSIQNNTTDEVQPDNNLSPATAIAATTQLINTTQQPRLDIKFEIKSYDTQAETTSAVSQLALQGSRNQKQTTVITSDSIKLINNLYNNKSIQEINANGSVFIVYDNSAERFTKSAAAYIKKSYQGDKIGFIIATYTTAVETLMWIHVAPLSIIEKSANIVYTIGLALYFKLNKDKWTEHTNIIKKPFEYFLKSSIENTKTRQITSEFFANLTLATAISLIRIPLMSMTQIIDSGVSLGLFKMPLLLSIAGTASFFSWSEHQGRIDKDTQPISKFVFRRFSEIRSVLIATYASTAALLNPTIFGIAPWITLTVVGVTGLGIYLKGEQINSWIEKNLKSNALLNKLIHYNSSGLLSCEQLILNLSAE